ncbi:rod shape-determining protein [Streptomyces roseus]|uniref:rod shape-determining protein n=1 Tax=Streptomyces roseus TaxID=66430 RepID=UPI0037F82574
MSFVGCDMAVDLGTANTRVYLRGQGIVLDEPSVVAINTHNGAATAIGSEAKKVIGREPGNTVAVRPLRNGVIADFEITQRLIRYFTLKVHRRRWAARPRIVVSVPSGITGVERRAVIEACAQAGARHVHVLDQPMAAALGSGLPVHEAAGSMVVSIGGGITEVAVISLGEIVTAQSTRVAGDVLDDAIVQHVKKEYSLLLGERTAEHIKITIGSACQPELNERIEIRGRDLVSGLPREVVIPATEIRTAMEGPVNAIVGAVKSTLGECPPELSGDIIARGIVLTGGGALLHGLDTRLRNETGIPIHIADRPLDSVALGAGKCVEDFQALQPVLRTRPRR